MKKYTETKKKAPFDWFKALSKDCKDMNEKELEALAVKSGDWVTCACGNQCSIIPRDEEGMPLDKKLHTLGGNFHVLAVARMENAMYNYHNVGNTDLPISADEAKYNEREKKKYLKQANAFRLKAIAMLPKIEVRSKELIEDEVYKMKDVLKQFGYKVSK